MRASALMYALLLYLCEVYSAVLGDNTIEDVENIDRKLQWLRLVFHSHLQLMLGGVYYVIIVIVEVVNL